MSKRCFALAKLELLLYGDSKTGFQLAVSIFIKHIDFGCALFTVKSYIEIGLDRGYLRV